MDDQGQSAPLPDSIQPYIAMYKLVPWWLRDGQERALRPLAMSRIETQPPQEQRVYDDEPVQNSCVKRIALIGRARMDLQC